MTDRTDRADDLHDRELQASPPTAVMLMTLAAIAIGGLLGTYGFARGGVADARTMPATTDFAMRAPSASDRTAGLADALRRGVISRGGPVDVDAWARHQRADVSPLDPASRRSLAGLAIYVVRGDFTVPHALKHAPTAVFVVPPGGRQPRGDAGDSLVLDVATGTCRGGGCARLMR